jgi:hypothetical protein
MPARPPARRSGAVAASACASVVLLTCLRAAVQRRRRSATRASRTRPWSHCTGRSARCVRMPARPPARRSGAVAASACASVDLLTRLRAAVQRRRRSAMHAWRTRPGSHSVGRSLRYAHVPACPPAPARRSGAAAASAGVEWFVTTCVFAVGQRRRRCGAHPAPVALRVAPRGALTGTRACPRARRRIAPALPSHRRVRRTVYSSACVLWRSADDDLRRERGTLDAGRTARYAHVPARPVSASFRRCRRVVGGRSDPADVPACVLWCSADDDPWGERDAFALSGALCAVRAHAGALASASFRRRGRRSDPADVPLCCGAARTTIRGASVGHKRAPLLPAVCRCFAHGACASTSPRHAAALTLRHCIIPRRLSVAAPGRPCRPSEPP